MSDAERERACPTRRLAGGAMGYPLTARLIRRRLSRGAEAVLVQKLVAFHGETTRARLLLPLKSPSRAALGERCARIAKVVGDVTGGWRRLRREGARGEGLTLRLSPCYRWWAH